MAFSILFTNAEICCCNAKSGNYGPQNKIFFVQFADITSQKWHSAVRKRRLTSHYLHFET